MCFFYFLFVGSWDGFVRLRLCVCWEGVYEYFGEYVGMLGYGVCCFGYVCGGSIFCGELKVVFGFGNAWSMSRWWELFFILVHFVKGVKWLVVVTIFFRIFWISDIYGVCVGVGGCLIFGS